MARAQITVTRNFKLAVPRLMSATAMRAVGLELCVKIENRTRSGRDETGHAFTQYSEEYARRVKGGRLAPVTLSHRPVGMLNELDVLVATPTRIGIGFRSAAMEQRAEYHDGLVRNPGVRGSNPLRRFMGVHPSWVEAAVRKIRASLMF